VKGKTRFFITAVALVAPSTPCAIIETGYITSRADCDVIVDDPGKAAGAIAAGIILYLSERPSLRPDALVARVYGPMIVAADGSALRSFPGDAERITAVLPAGTVVRPTYVENGRVELVQWETSECSAG
jgi:hypothetical protein